MWPSRKHYKRMAHFTLSIKYSIKSRKLSRCNYSVKSSRVYSKPLAGARAGDGGAIIGEDQGYIDASNDAATSNFSVAAPCPRESSAHPHARMFARIDSVGPVPLYAELAAKPYVPEILEENVDVQGALSPDGYGSGEDARYGQGRQDGAICFVRGIYYAKQNAFEFTKKCFKDAVQTDFQYLETSHARSCSGTSHLTEREIVAHYATLAILTQHINTNPKHNDNITSPILERQDGTKLPSRSMPRIKDHQGGGVVWAMRQLARAALYSPKSIKHQREESRKKEQSDQKLRIIQSSDLARIEMRWKMNLKQSGIRGVEASVVVSQLGKD
ncbi:hypothetical protein DER45DRAFT_544917 [Fusarium avenaceum]|nr:hypothetical protein DER45DRAFT_544917 [Fusarium avenaceum]